MTLDGWNLTINLATMVVGPVLCMVAVFGVLALAARLEGWIRNVKKEKE